jgi:hypothetical protein
MPLRDWTVGVIELLLFNFSFFIITKKSETIFETDFPVFAEYSLADSIKRSSSLNVNFVFITEPQYLVLTDSFVNIIRQKERSVNIRDDHGSSCALSHWIKLIFGYLCFPEVHGCQGET